MDATCNVQDSIHVFHLVHNMCPGFWVHIKIGLGLKGYFNFSRDGTTALVMRTVAMTSMSELVDTIKPRKF